MRFEICLGCGCLVNPLTHVCLSRKPLVAFGERSAREEDALAKRRRDDRLRAKKYRDKKRLERGNERL